MKAILLLLLIGLTVNAQSVRELRQKYGEPVSEIFQVRPNVTVTVRIGRTGDVCEMVIAPQLPSTAIKSNDYVFKSAVLNEIIDELVPASQRGESLMGGFLNLRCLPQDDCAGTSDDYENLNIYRNGGDDAHRYATIQWKRTDCKIPSPPNNGMNPMRYHRAP
jgi:hypothetical protein